MNTFPYDMPAPNFNFSDEKSDKAVLVKDMSSGYPSLNKLFTFDPRTFNFELHVSDWEKLEIMTFYENNKDVPFYWTNKQGGSQYEVIFVKKPGCRIDRLKNRWRMGFSFRQSTP